MVGGRRDEVQAQLEGDKVQSCLGLHLKVGLIAKTSQSGILPLANHWQYPTGYKVPTFKYQGCPHVGRYLLDR